MYTYVYVMFMVGGLAFGWEMYIYIFYKCKLLCTHYTYKDALLYTPGMYEYAYMYRHCRATHGIRRVHI